MRCVQSCASWAFGSLSCEPVLLSRVLPISQPSLTQRASALHLPSLQSPLTSVSRWEHLMLCRCSEYGGQRWFLRLFAQSFQMASLPGTWAHL